MMRSRSADRGRRTFWSFNVPWTELVLKAHRVDVAGYSVRFMVKPCFWVRICIGKWVIYLDDLPF